MKLPKEYMRNELQRLGRDLSPDDEIAVEWQGEALGLRVKWRDGFEAFIGLGPEASAMILADLTPEAYH